MAQRIIVPSSLGMPGGKLVIQEIGGIKYAVFVPQDIFGDLSSGLSSAINTFTGAVSAAQRAGSGAVSAAQQAVSAGISGAVAAAPSIIGAVSGVPSVAAAAIVAQLPQVSLPTISLPTISLPSISALPTISLSNVEIPSLSTLNAGLASLSPIQIASAASITPLEQIEIPSGIQQSTTTPTIDLGAIEKQLSSVLGSLPGSLSADLAGLGASISKTGGSITETLQALSPIPIVSAAPIENEQIQISGNVVPAKQPTVETNPVLATLGQIGNLGANSALTLVGGLAATPGALIDIGTDLGNLTSGWTLSRAKELYYGLPSGSVYTPPAIETDLQKQSQTAVLNAIEASTGYKVNPDLLTEISTPSAVQQLQSSNIFERGLGAGSLLAAGIGDWVLQNPVLAGSGTGQLLQIASQPEQVVEMAKGFGTLFQLVTTGKVAEEQAVTQQKATEGQVIERYTLNPSLAGQQSAGATISAGSAQVVDVYVPTDKSYCDGLLVGSASAVNAGC